MLENSIFSIRVLLSIIYVKKSMTKTEILRWKKERERESVQKLSQIDIPTFNRCNIRLKKNILKMDPKFFLLRSFDE